MRTRWPAGRFLRALTAPLMLAAALTALGSAGAAAAVCQGWTGGQPPSPGTDTNQLNGVTVLSACDAWVVGVDSSRTAGVRTLIEHWTGGSSWTVVPSPNPVGGRSFLTGIRAISPSDIWAVGSTLNSANERTMILHWNGVAWLQVPSPNPGTFNELSGVRAVSANDVWAVGHYSGDSGNQSLILHWDGHAWTQVPSPSPGGASGTVLTAVTATSAKDAWAVGDYFGDGQNPQLLTLTLHWDGFIWKQVSSPDPAPGDIGINHLTSVDATSATDAWAVGFFPDGTVNHTMILHWNGAAWTQLPSPNPPDDNRLDGVAAISGSDAWAVGTTTGSHGFRTTLTAHWDGAAWNQVPSLNVGGPGSENSLAGVAATAFNDAWAVGEFGSPTQALAIHLKCC